MPAADLDLLIAAARDAGEIARGYAGGVLDISHKSHDNSPVTDADHAVNDALHDTLRGARPDYGWLSEETPDTPDRLSARRVFIVDPIDGTRSFIEGSGTWAHSLAVVQNGSVTAAVVYLPMRDKLYAAALGQGATLNGNPLSVSQTPVLERSEVLATKPVLDPGFWPGGVPQMRRAYRPSLAYRLCLVAEGRFDAMFTFRPSWEWDIAAGALILQEAGARATERTGAALRFNAAHPQTDGVIAANPALHRDLLARLGHAQPGAA